MGRVVQRFDKYSSAMTTYNTLDEEYAREIGSHLADLVWELDEALGAQFWNKALGIKTPRKTKRKKRPVPATNIFSKPKKTRPWKRPRQIRSLSSMAQKAVQKKLQTKFVPTTNKKGVPK